MLLSPKIGLFRSNCWRHFRGIAGGSTLERSGRRKLVEERPGLRSLVSYEHEKNALRHGRRSFHSRENTMWHRERRVKYERCVRQMLVSVKIVDYNKIGKQT